MKTVTKFQIFTIQTFTGQVKASRFRVAYLLRAARSRFPRCMKNAQRNGIGNFIIGDADLSIFPNK